MYRPRVLLLILVVSSLIILFPSSSIAAWPTDGVASFRVAIGSGNQHSPVAIPDGNGGAYVAWSDDRSGASNTDVYLQRVTAAGTVAPGWPDTGYAVCTVAGDQFPTALVPDDAGGVIVTWWDRREGPGNYDIYAHRITGSCTVAPGWTVNGVPVSTYSGDEAYPAACTDGAGGAFIAWQARSPSLDWDIHAARVTADGAVTLLTIANTSSHEDVAQVVTDDAGGLFVAWTRLIGGADTDVYVARVTSDLTMIGPVSVAPLSSAAGVHRLAEDGLGGVYVAWVDSRNVSDIFASHYDSQLNLTTGWTVNGKRVSSTPPYPISLRAIPDGQGGLLVSWGDVNADAVGLQRMLRSGGTAPRP